MDKYAQFEIEKKKIEDNFNPRIAAQTEKNKLLHADIESLIKFVVQKETEQENLADKQRELRKLIEHHKQTQEEIKQDKIRQIDELRKQMLMQIRAVKIKMLNMNEDQLVGTTKLTVIQNAQLTGELDY